MTNPESTECDARCAELLAWIRVNCNPKPNGDGDFAKAREHAIQTYGDFFKKNLVVNCMCNAPGGCLGIHFDDALK